MKISIPSAPTTPVLIGAIPPAASVFHSGTFGERQDRSHEGRLWYSCRPRVAL
jgi:hypothetical protein